MHTKYSFTVLMSVISFERNGSYGNAELKLENFFSVKKSLLEINFNQMTMNSLVSPFGLTGSTIATIAYANSEERSNLL